MQLPGKWRKIGESEPVDVYVHGFSQARSADRDLRPVAIVEEVGTGNLRFVDLTYVTIERPEYRL